MKKKFLVLLLGSMLTLGVVTVAYAQDTISSNVSNYRMSMMSQYSTKNDTYNNMINIMRNNGFEDAANAMGNKDFNAMNDFMNNLTDEQYNKMIDIMQNNGYGSMAKMMQSVSKDEMINMHNSMMGR
jgi:phosphoglycerol transferase MdoB-like AlkP superfamily enzyme